MPDLHIQCLKSPSLHITCAMIWSLRYWSRVVRSKIQISTPTSLGLSWEWEMSIHRRDKVQGIHMNIYFLRIPIWKNSQVAYSHHSYKMSHLHNFPCSTFPFSIKGHVQNSHSSHTPFQALWTTRHEGEFFKKSLLGHKWKSLVAILIPP